MASVLGAPTKVGDTAGSGLRALPHFAAQGPQERDERALVVDRKANRTHERIETRIRVAAATSL